MFFSKNLITLTMSTINKAPINTNSGSRTSTNCNNDCDKKTDIILPESNACISEAGKASALNPKPVWYFQQMSLFTELKACVRLSGLPQSEYPSSSFCSHLYAWFPFIL